MRFGLLAQAYVSSTAAEHCRIVECRYLACERAQSSINMVSGALSFLQSYAWKIKNPHVPVHCVCVCVSVSVC